MSSQAERTKILEDQVGSLIFSPSEVGARTVNAVQAAQADPDCLKWGIPQLDDHFVMNRRKKFCGLLGDVSMYKSTMMKLLAQNAVSQLKPDEIIMYFTWEETVEDFGMSVVAPIAKVPLTSLFLGSVQESEWKRTLRAAAQLSGKPLWVVGHSEADEKRRPRMTMSDVEMAFEYVTDVQKKKVRLAFFDYLQRINLADNKIDDTRMSFVRCVDRLKDVAMQFSPTLYVASQIKREVASRKYRQPQKHDAQETSNFEQTADALLSVWSPYKEDNWQVGEAVRELKDGTAINVSKELLLIETLKQKKGEAPVTRAVDILPEYGKIVRYGTADIERKLIRDKMERQND